MGQYWYVIAPRRRERWSEVSGDKLGEWLCTEVPSRIVSLLMKPVGNIAQARDVMASKLKPARRATHNAGPAQLMDLPTEMHDKIFSYADFLDIISLCMTCQDMYVVGVRHVRAAVARCAGPWAGEPIICLGDYADTLPKILLDDDEVSHQLSPPSNDKDLGSDDESNEGHALYSRVREYKEVSHSSLPSFRKHPQYRKICKEVGYYGLAYRCFSHLSSPYRIEQDLRFPRRPWVLRNLTTKEFVRENLIEPLSLGDAVCCRICWSDDPSISLAYDGGIHRGIWAGHRFDIVGSGMMDKAKDEGWTDVSASVMEELDAIWSSDVGSDWRTEVFGEENDSE